MENFKRNWFWAETRVLMLFIAFVVGSFVVGLFDIAKDSTDSKNGRSNLSLHIDALTGCHYLGGPRGGLVKRTDSYNNHICSGESNEQ